MIDAPEQAVILIGGPGTRTGPPDLPAPLLAAGERPFLDYTIENCVRFGFRRILMLASGQTDCIQNYIDSRRERWPGVVFDLSIEREPYGTAGALRYASSKLEQRFLLLNGESFFDTNWLDLVTDLQNGDPAVVMALRRVADTSHFGVVELDRGEVTGFSERDDGRDGLITGGIYLVDRRILKHLPERGSLDRYVLPALCANHWVRGRIQDGCFIDIGTPEGLSAAQTDMPKCRKRPAVFFDRDGTLNADAGYTFRPQDLVFLPGAIAAVKRVNDAGLFAFLVTNQSGIARGYFTEHDMHLFHEHLQRHLRSHGAHLDDIRYCPDHPEGTVAPYNRMSDFRKPAPGMLLDLMRSWPVDIERSLAIGDKLSDVQAAEAAGVKGVLYANGNVDGYIAMHLAAR